MSLWQGLRARLRALISPRAADAALREEIRFHIERETERNVAAGMSHDEARRVAAAHFGGVERVREEHRDVRRFRWVEDFAADARFALRSLRRSPALSGTAVITLALGIGANVAIFSAVNAVVLEPLPFPHSERLMVVSEENPEKHWHLNVAAPANLFDWRAGVSDFADVTGYLEHPQRATLTGRGDPQILSESYAMGNLFSVLGAHAAMGRTLADDENWHEPKSTAHVLVLSDKGWRTHFAADPAIVGKSAVVDGQTFQIVGVMPPSFAFPDETVDFWRSFEWDPAQRADPQFRRAHYLRAIARLKPGAAQARANAQLQSVVDRLKHDYPATNKYMGALMMPMHDFVVGDTRLPLLVLLTSVGFLLLIACANVGNLLLVQAAGREREAALRLALGAGRARLVRQALTESLVLSMIGGSIGLALGWAGTRAFVRLQPNGLLRVRDFGVDGLVLGYVVAITVASALIFGVAPALWSRHRSPAESLKDGGRGAAQGGRAKRWGETLVVAEVALALLMTVAAGLLVRSFMQLVRVDPGFDPHGVLAAGVGVNAKYDTSTKVDAFMSELETRLGAVPGVTGVALASNTPFAGTSYTADFILYGWPNGKYATEIGNRTVSTSYFATMKVPVLSGRTFGAEDRDGSARVIVINQALADRISRARTPSVSGSRSRSSRRQRPSGTRSLASSAASTSTASTRRRASRHSTPKRRNPRATWSRCCARTAIPLRSRRR